MVVMGLDNLAIDEKWIRDNETKEYDEIIYDDNNKPINVNEVMNSVKAPVVSFEEEKKAREAINKQFEKANGLLDIIGKAAEESKVNEIMDSVEVPEVEFEEEKDSEHFKKAFDEVYKNVELENVIKDNSLTEDIQKVVSSETLQTKKASGEIETDGLSELLAYTNSLTKIHGKSNYDMWNDEEKEKYLELYSKVYNVSREQAINNISHALSSSNKKQIKYEGINRETIKEEGIAAKTILSDIYKKYNDLSYDDQQRFLELYNQLKKVAFMKVSDDVSERQQLSDLLNVASQISSFKDSIDTMSR